MDKKELKSIPYEPSGLCRLCREIFGTDEAEKLRAIARKAKAYDHLMKKDRPVNLRGAGRKQCFTDAEVDMLITLYQEGKSIQFLAEHFDGTF